MVDTDDTSSQVGQILEVLDRIKRQAPSSLKKVRMARLDAIRYVAKSRGIRTRSVRDKLWRKLELKMGSFDRMVLGWLTSDSQTLRKVILKHAARGYLDVDRRTTNGFFSDSQRAKEDAAEYQMDIDQRDEESELDDEAVRAMYDRRFKKKKYDVPDKFGRRTVRIGRSLWRAAVLSNFGQKCCICHIDVRELLDAAHIKSWSKAPKSRLDPRNGLCLCALHHRAFDKRFIRIRKGIIHVSDQFRKPPNVVQRELLAKYHRRKAVRPRVWRVGW